jgi:hypothetical protein
LLLDQLQLLERHLQQTTVDWVEFGASAERVAQLGLRGAQLLIGHGGQSRWLGLPFSQRFQHAPCANA